MATDQLIHTGREVDFDAVFHHEGGQLDKNGRQINIRPQIVWKSCL